MYSPVVGWKGQMRVRAQSQSSARGLAPRSPTGGASSLARALAVAALRETYEETGLVIGRLEDGEFRPDLSDLSYVGRAITPSNSERRFHARFFATHLDELSQPLGGSGELLDLEWYSFEEAMSLRIIDVTTYMLEETLRRHRDVASPHRYPFVFYRRGRRVVFE